MRERTALDVIVITRVITTWYRHIYIYVFVRYDLIVIIIAITSLLQAIQRAL